MKKTLFLMLTLIVALGLTTNDKCHAKKTTGSPVAAVVEQTESTPKATTTEANCSQCCDDSQYSSQFSSWFAQAKAWFASLFGTKVTKNDDLENAAHISQNSDQSTSNDPCADGSVCSEGEAIPFSE